eukprot:jgi/Chrpa1/14636/Chrysochromulina_OHIO_Genome00018476-RA
MTGSAGTSERGVLKGYVRGLISNGVALALLYAISCIPGMRQYVCLSLALQWGVFIVHALPNTSEKFYDLSGSATHFSLVAVSLCSAARVHTPRQLLIAILSIVWMTRLGTFLFLRISRDGKDERFDSLKRVWLSWLGAWTIQALWVTLIQLPVVLVNDRDDVAPLGLTDALALALWVAGFLLETLADVQKFVFRADAANRHRYITSGLWRLCRHPNYCGEIAMWVAMAASRPGINDVLDSLQRNTVCTGTQCFETEADAFGLTAVPSANQPNAMFFMMMMFMMLVAVMMKLKKPAPTITETKPGSSSSHANQPPPPPPTVS